jgi:hypothetical protein
VPYDSYSIHVDSEIKLLRNIKKFNRLPHVFLFKTGIAGVPMAFPTYVCISQELFHIP